MKKNRHYIISNRMQNMYRDFIKGSPRNKRLIANQTLYSAIIYNIFRKIIHYMMFESFVFTLKRLGKFRIIKYLPEIKEREDGVIITNKVLDVASTSKAIRETGNNKIRVYFDNEATGGYIYRMKWDNYYAAFPNKTFYKFSLSRPLGYLLKENILQNKVVAQIVDYKL